MKKESWNNYGLPTHTHEFNTGDKVRVRPFPNIHMLPGNLQQALEHHLTFTVTGTHDDDVEEPAHSQILHFAGHSSSGFWWELVK